jgi:hypothetical protein
MTGVRTDDSRFTGQVPQVTTAVGILPSPQATLP